MLGRWDYTQSEIVPSNQKELDLKGKGLFLLVDKGSAHTSVLRLARASTVQRRDSPEWC